MNAFLEILIIATPLLLAAFGALVSEYAGRMAIFLESFINLGAFLCFACTVQTQSLVPGIIMSLTICTGFILLDAIIIEKIHANPFLSALALNLLCNALISVISARMFGTRGTLVNAEMFTFQPVTTRIVTSIAAYLITGAGILWLTLSKSGLCMRITGSDSAVLTSRGIAPKTYRIIAWGVAAFYAGAAGCIISLRLSSFVPNAASGTGWTALAAVFLGKKNTATVIAAVFVFGAAQYGAAHIQNIAGLQSIPSALLLALPYLAALLLILVVPGKQQDHLS
jgi:ABC-type uncharacterized transport system permease subunit